MLLPYLSWPKRGSGILSRLRSYRRAKLITLMKVRYLQWPTMFTMSIKQFSMYLSFVVAVILAKPCDALRKAHPCYVRKVKQVQGTLLKQSVMRVRYKPKFGVYNQCVMMSYSSQQKNYVPRMKLSNRLLQTASCQLLILLQVALRHQPMQH